MNRLFRYVNSAFALVIALFFLLMGIGLFWMAFPPDGGDAYVLLFISFGFLAIGTYAVLNPGRVRIGSGGNRHRR